MSERFIRMTGGYWVARLKRAMTAESVVRLITISGVLTA